MNDTHGEAGRPWTGFDLDGTLAVYDKWEGIDHIGKPVKPMVDLIKELHDEGKVVKILTARVAPRTLDDGTVGIQKAMVPVVNLNEYLKEPKSPFDLEGNQNTIELNAKQIIEFWCEKHLGFVPEITHEKDHLMVNLYDDRVTEVVPNQGITIRQRLDYACECVDYWRMKYNGGSLKYLCFLLGLGIGFVGAFLLFFCCVTGARDVPRDAASRLHKASEELVSAIDNYNASCTTQKIGPITIPPKEDKE